MLTKKKIIIITIVSITVIIIIALIIFLIIFFIQNHNQNIMTSIVTSSVPISNSVFDQNQLINNDISNILESLSFPPGYTLSYSGTNFNGNMPFFLLNQGVNKLLSANTSSVYLQSYPTGSDVTSTVINSDAYFTLKITNIVNSNNYNMFTFYIQQFIENNFSIILDTTNNTVSSVKTTSQTLLLLPITIPNMNNRFIMIAQSSNSGESGCQILDINTSNNSFIFSNFDPNNITNTQLWNIFPIIPQVSAFSQIPDSSPLYGYNGSTFTGGDLFYIVQISTNNILSANTSNGTTLYYLSPSTIDRSSLWYIQYAQSTETLGPAVLQMFWMTSAWWQVTQSIPTGTSAYLDINGSTPEIFFSSNASDAAGVPSDSNGVPAMIGLYQPSSTAYNNSYVLVDLAYPHTDVLGGTITPTIETLDLYYTNYTPDELWALVPAYF